MRLVEFAQKTLKEMLAEIDRRGFLKGLGAAMTSAAVPSIAKAANDVQSYIEKMVSDDPKILLYMIEDNTLILYINGPAIEKGYKNNLEVNKKLRARGKDVKDPKDALEYYGFNDLNKKYIKSKIGLNVEYQLINTQEELNNVHRKKMKSELERDLADADAIAKSEQDDLEQRRASSRASDATEIERIKSQIRDKVKREWAWSGDNTKLEVKYRINLSANGDILDLQKIGASGDSSFDVSVSQAIRLAKPLPVPKDELLFRENFDPLFIRFTVEELRN